jgi:hypothetical protein
MHIQTLVVFLYLALKVIGIPRSYVYPYVMYIHFNKPYNMHSGNFFGIPYMNTYPILASYSKGGVFVWGK